VSGSVKVKLSAELPCDLYGIPSVTPTTVKNVEGLGEDTTIVAVCPARPPKT
jgi:hypothetical protein